MSLDEAAQLLSFFPAFKDASLSLVSGGLINQTYLARTGEREDQKLILQRINPIFNKDVCKDIDALTQYLDAKRLRTPKVVRTKDNALYVETKEQRTWRALTFIEGKTHHIVRDGRHAHAAGALVAAFHKALEDFDYTHVFSRGNVHHLQTHVDVLHKALQEHKDHRLYNALSPLAEQLLKAIDGLPSFEDLPLRFAHGDLKISNILFDDDDQGICLVDLDTTSKMIWPFEMGDAFRSWCNPGREDEQCAFDLKRFTGGLFGYASVFSDVKPTEHERLVDGIACITLELSARFLADALNESYFGFDGGRFATRGEHNLARAKGQFALYQSLHAQRDAAQKLVQEAFG